MKNIFKNIIFKYKYILLKLKKKFIFFVYKKYWRYNILIKRKTNNVYVSSFILPLLSSIFII